MQGNFLTNFWQHSFAQYTDLNFSLFDKRYAEIKDAFEKNAEELPHNVGGAEVGCLLSWRKGITANRATLLKLVFSLHS